MDSLVHVDLLQEIADVLLGLLEGLIVVEIDLLFFEGTNEPLGKGIFSGAHFGGYTDLDLLVLKPRNIAVRQILETLIGMMDLRRWMVC